MSSASCSDSMDSDDETSSSTSESDSDPPRPTRHMYCAYWVGWSDPPNTQDVHMLHH